MTNALTLTRPSVTFNSGTPVNKLPRSDSINGSFQQQSTGYNQPDLLRLPLYVINYIAGFVATGNDLKEKATNAVRFGKVCVLTYEASRIPGTDCGNILAGVKKLNEVEKKEFASWTNSLFKQLIIDDLDTNGHRGYIGGNLLTASHAIWLDRGRLQNNRELLEYQTRTIHTPIILLDVKIWIQEGNLRADGFLKFSQKNVFELCFSNEKHETIPPALFNFLELTSLKIDHNKLSRIPNEIKQLIKLRTLDVSHNQLTELPDSMGELVKLGTLNVSHNQLRRLPLSMENLSSLEVDLKGNPVSWWSKRKYLSFDRLKILFD